MKKYIKPTTTIVGIKAQAILAGSYGANAVTGIEGLGVSNTNHGGGTIDSRSGDIWYDDDEEDF